MIRGPAQKETAPAVVYSSLLNGVATNLLCQLPSQIIDKDVQELEVILNDLYIQAYQNNWPTDLQEAVLEALSRASELCDGINKGRPGKPRGKEFFRSIKRFVRLLQMIAIFLDEPAEDPSYLKVDIRMQNP